MKLESVSDPFPELERYELQEAPRYDFRLDRRDFFKFLGAGIVVCLVNRSAGAWQPAGRRRGRGGRGRGGGGPAEIGAWLHINDAGLVTVYTGKVEIGQNARTSLSQAVAEELRIPIASIQLVMADTDLVPYDGGTAGSGTTPRMAPQLRRVAAAARELLIENAAKQLGVERNSISVVDGKVSHAATGRALTFGELAKGQQLAKAVAGDAPLTPAVDWKTAGSPIPKVDGRAFVTGKHEYASDIRRPGMLFAKILRPPGLSATLKKVDVGNAQAEPGVVVVHDGSFVAVAAPNLFKAEQALGRIKAEWNVTEKSSNNDQLAADLKRKSASQAERPNGARANGGRPSGGSGGGGFGRRTSTSEGSVAAGLAAADQKISATYTIAYIAHVPLEPRAAVAEWANGKLTVWTGTQMPFRVRSSLAQTFGLPTEKVRVIVPDMGSGYGGKHTGEAAIEAARLAKGAGKPVKLVWTREEEFTWAYFRPAGVIEVTAGVRNDGAITAWEFHNYNSGPSALRPLYEIANQHCAFHNSDSPLRQGSYRALAATANHFARESHIDDLAHAVKRDPLAFRLQNLKDARLRAVLEAAAKKFDWKAAQPAANHGVGIAGGSEKGSYVATCAEVVVDPKTGRVRVERVVAAFECGAIVNPDHLQNQVEGAAMMGLGGALFESIQFGGDKILNAGLTHYRVPRFSDTPQIDVVLLDRKDLPSAGAGETPIVAIAPAIGNAIFQATGTRCRSMPMAPNGVKI